METVDKLLAYLPDEPYVQAGAIVVLAFVLAKVADWIVRRTLITWAKRSSSNLDDQLFGLFHRPVVTTVMLIGLVIAAQRLEMSEKTALVTRRSLLTIALFVWAIFALRITGILLNMARGASDRYPVIEDRTFPLFNNLAKVLLVAGAAYLGISIWNIDATGALASAGIVGIAVGFAAQDTLANLFAGVFIIADEPYNVGDFIILESGERGQVLNIGLRSTRILTRDDIEMTIPNNVMGSARITNESSGPSPKHRVRVQVGAAYGSDVDQVRAVLLASVEGQENVCTDPEPRVRFRKFGDSALEFELLCWIPEPVLRGRTLDALNTEVYKRFAKEGIEIPYPKRDVYVREMPGTSDRT